MRDDRSSYTELSTLADCERKWWFKYLQRADDAQTVQQFRGSALHDLVAGWRQGDERPAVDRLYGVGERDIEEIEEILWLFDRYKRYYANMRRPRIVANELRVESELPGTGISILTFVDEIVQVSGGGLWAVERKSMNGWRRMSTLEVDPQVSITMWNLHLNDWPVEGVIYDAINTHHYVGTVPTQREIKRIAAEHGEKLSVDEIKLRQSAQRTEEPLESSFRMEWLTRNPEHIIAAMAEMVAGLKRRADLAAGDVPMRNIGQHCDWCRFKHECWAGLEFNTDIEVV